MSSQSRYRLLSQALQYYDTAEIPGPDSNPLIIEWFQNWGAGWQSDDSRLAWCSIFVNQMCKEAGLVFSGKLNARSWLDEGEPTNDPQPGDITVLWRENPNSWKGHVGIFVKRDRDHVWLLGGNQSNTVSISKYDINRVLGYRTPISAIQPNRRWS